MTEQGGETSRVPEPQPQTPTEATKGVLNRMKETGDAKIAALWGGAAVLSAMSAIDNMNSGNIRDAILFGIGTAMFGFCSAAEAKLPKWTRKNE